jgi:hypothetical protein
MSNQIVADEIQTIHDVEGVIDSATALVNTIASKIAAAVEAALANGASAAELQPLADLQVEIKAKADALAAAVAANA